MTNEQRLAILSPMACQWFPSVWRERDAAERARDKEHGIVRVHVETFDAGWGHPTVPRRRGW